MSLFKKKKDPAHKQRRGYGGDREAGVKGVHQSSYSDEKDKGRSDAGDALRGSGNKNLRGQTKEYLQDLAYASHHNKLQELKAMKKPKLLAHGGMAGDYQSSCTADCNSPCEVHNMGEDLVGQVLKGRKMSQGGKVANEQGSGVDGLPNEFDDLALRDDLEFSYTGANSGDERGDSSLLDDAVAKVMLRRRKQHNPKPA